MYQEGSPSLTDDGLVIAFDSTSASLSSEGTTIYFNYDTDVLGGRNADVWTATRACE